MQNQFSSTTSQFTAIVEPASWFIHRCDAPTPLLSRLGERSCERPEHHIQSYIRFTLFSFLFLFLFTPFSFRHVSCYPHCVIATSTAACFILRRCVHSVNGRMAAVSLFMHIGSLQCLFLMVFEEAVSRNTALRADASVNTQMPSP